MAYSAIENKYLSALASYQFPDPPAAPEMPEMAAPDQPPEDVLLAAGPSGTMTDAGGGMPTIKPTPRNPVMGGIADFVRGVRDLANQYEIKEFVPLLGGMGVGDLLMGKSPEELENWAYGNSPIAMPPRGTGGLVPVVKTGRKEGLADTVFLGLDAAGLAKGAVVAGRGAKVAGKALAPKAGEKLDAYMQRTGLQQNLMAYHGTPHSFDKFDASKIGTGEGAQAYGYGLYFAESKDVAKGYQIKLSSDGSARNLVNQFGGVDGAIAETQRRIDNYNKLVSDGGGGMMERAQGMLRLSEKTLSDLQSMKAGKPVNKGTFFTVDIPDPVVKKMLDFDTPISEQSQEIQALAKQYNLSMDDLGGDLLAAADGKTPEGAQRLREAGVPGVRYLDQGSRSNFKVQNNYKGKPYGEPVSFMTEKQAKDYAAEQTAKGFGTDIIPGSRNIVVFPGGEEQIKILSREGNK